MSEENKNLGEEAKDAAKKAAEKAKGKASELKEDAKEVFEDVKEEAKEFVEDAKEATKEFTDEAKQVMNDGKSVAIIAHLTLIGWIIALVMNSSNKTEFGSFYIRQVLGIMLLGFLSFIPFLGILVGIFCFALWLISLINTLNGNTKPIFVLGDQFQEWFKSI